MLTSDQLGVLKQATEIFGEDVRNTVAIEELAECIQAITRLERGRGNVDALAEEISDVLVSLHQLIQDYDLGVRVRIYCDFKIRRLNDRIEKRDFNSR